MLALTDVGLARLCIAATAVPRAKRGAALRAAARAHDPSGWTRCRIRKKAERVKLLIEVNKYDLAERLVGEGWDAQALAENRATLQAEFQLAINTWLDHE